MRQINTAIFMVRCKGLGFSLDELEQIDFGLVQDMLIEQSNDEYEYPTKASQKDFDKFRGQ